MRAFIAIEVTKELQEHLLEIQSKFRGLGRMSFPKTFHLTLKFLGEISKPEVIIEKLEKISFNEFTLELSDIGVFPNMHKARVLWAGLKSNDVLTKLVQNIENSLGKNDKPFLAHLTLARIKFMKDKDKFRELLREIEVQKLSFEVKEFVLFKSTLLPDGPVYEKINIFKHKT